MSDIWDTKDGPRRVRRDPPTIDDAALAAVGLTEDLEGQVEIVTSLMPVSAEEARLAVLKLRHANSDTRRIDSRLMTARRGGGSRAVVVERKSPRRTAAALRASAGRRDLG
jgi:hypothetical protein